METITVTNSKRPLMRGNSSFRLRSSSLNSVRLRRTFDLFDQNADGFITVGELCQALQMLGLNTDLQEIKSLVSSNIRPGNIGLEFEDFKSLHSSLNDAFYGLDVVAEREKDEKEEKEYLRMKKQEEEESDLSEAFKVFDENGDGYISAHELQRVLRKLGMTEEGKEICKVEAMILCADTNCDGRIDFFEFKDMMRSVLVHTA